MCNIGIQIGEVQKREARGEVTKLLTVAVSIKGGHQLPGKGRSKEGARKTSVLLYP